MQIERVRKNDEPDEMGISRERTREIPDRSKRVPYRIPSKVTSDRNDKSTANSACV